MTALGEEFVRGICPGKVVIWLTSPQELKSLKIGLFVLLLLPSAVKLHSTHNIDVIYNTHTFKQALLMFQCSVSHSCQSRVHMSSKGQKLLYRRSKPIFQLKALGLSSIVPGRCTFKYKLVLHYCP